MKVKWWEGIGNRLMLSGGRELNAKNVATDGKYKSYQYLRLIF
jgi:hypothetical protein